jgi:tRNA(adenine34) deaminase
MLTPEDEKFMREALKEASKALKQGEVPIGAVLVLDGKVIARGHNQVEMLQDATAHAEMLCITSGTVALENWRLNDATLYSTLEPCPMCAGAAILSRVKRIVWGAPDLRHGANGSWVNIFEKSHPIHNIEIEGHLLEGESADLLRNFFRQRRVQNEQQTEDSSF